MAIPPAVAAAVWLCPHGGFDARASALEAWFFSSLNAVMTHYGTGPAPVIFGAGYVSQGLWWRVGFPIALLHCAIWLPIGFAWWRLIGLWWASGRIPRIGFSMPIDEPGGHCRSGP